MSGEASAAAGGRRKRSERLAARKREKAEIAPRLPSAAATAPWVHFPARSADFSEPAIRPGFAYLSSDRLDELRRRTFELLERHGVSVDHPAAVGRLGRAGCKVDAGGRLVRLPRELVEEAVRQTPKSVTLYGKSGRHILEVPRRDGTFHMRTGTGAHGFIDAETGAYRKLVLDDVRTIAAVGDGLAEVGFISHPFINDVPEATADIHGFAALLAQSEKHTWFQPYDARNVEYLIKLAVIAAGGERELRARPVVGCIACSFTPLEFKRMDIEVILQAARHGVPIHACSLPTAGGTAPVTMPGTVLMAAAEILAMVAMTHILGPGTPVIATPLIFALDMRTGRSQQSSVEALAGASMAVQLLKRGFGLMTHTYGAGSDTPEADGQSQAERALLSFLVGLSAADILGGVGQLECATVFSPLQAVIDNELGAMLRAYLRTPDIDDDTLAWELMLEVGPGGNFLANEHTLAHCRDAFEPTVFLKLARDAYEDAGRADAMARARDLVRKLVSREPPSGLPGQDAVAEMQAVVRDADRHILE